MVAGTNIVIYYSPSLGSLVINSTGAGGGGGAGTVTSFSSGDLSPLFTTSVATASTTPALSFSLSSQSANTFFAGPSSGAAAAPTFRAIVADDILGLGLGFIEEMNGSGTNTFLQSPTVNGGNFTDPTITGGYARDSGGATAISFEERQIVNQSGSIVLDWNDYLLGDLRDMTNASPAIATNNAVASDGWVLSKTGGNLKLVPQGSGSSWALRVQEIDGAPLVDNVTNILVSNGTLVDDGDGNVTITTSGGSSGISGVTNSGGVHSLISVSNPPAIGMKSISAGSNVTITDQGTNLVVSASGGGGGSLSAGIGTRDVTVNDSGSLYAGNIFPDNTVFTIDDEFLGGTTTSGQVGTLGWRVQTGSIAGTASPWGTIRNASIVTRVALQVASLAGGAPIPALGSITNYQIMARFKLGATNATSLIRVGVTGSDITAVNNWVMVSLSAATNAEFFNFQCNSSGSSDWALSSVAAVTNEWYTWRAWTTNQTDIYMAINNETPVVFTNGASMTANTPWFETAGHVSVIEMDRFSFRASNIDRY